MSGPFFVTAHAVTRYLERVDGSVSPGVAKWAIIHASESAVRLREKTPAGDLVYRSDNPPLLLVVKFDGDGHRGTVATVFPPHGSGDLCGAELDLIREYSAGLPSIVEEFERKARGEKRPETPRAKQPYLRGTAVELTEAEAANISLAIRSRPSVARAEFIEKVKGPNGGSIWRAWIGAHPALLVKYGSQVVREAVVDEGQMDG